jgi:hypothetical protein
MYLYLTEIFSKNCTSVSNQKMNKKKADIEWKEKEVEWMGLIELKLMSWETLGKKTLGIFDFLPHWTLLNIKELNLPPLAI